MLYNIIMLGPYGGVKRPSYMSSGYVAPMRRISDFNFAVPPQNMAGHGFFDSVGNFFRKAGNTIVDNLKKPSTWIGGASLIPSPLSPFLTGASAIAKLAGHGRRKRRTLTKAKTKAKKQAKKQAGGKKKRRK